MIVIDASAASEICLRLEGSDVATERLLRQSESLHAPHLLDLEWASVLRRIVHAGAMTARQARAAMEVFQLLPIERHPHQPLLDRIWALRANLTPYDASYVALAEGLDATLVTFDAHLGGAPGHRARIEVLQRP